MAFDHQTILNQLKVFKGLPTYQFERRIDAFILPFLEKAFNAKRGTDDFLLVYPEFPLYPKKENVFELSTATKHSDYADYLLWSKKLNVIYLVEFKSDSGSAKQEQFDMYILNCMRGWENLLRSYFDKTINSESWRKFAYGLDFLYRQAPELTGSPTAFNLNQFYDNKRGQGATAHLQSLYSNIKFESTPELKLVYLAPEKSLQNIDTASNDPAKYFQGLFTLSEFSKHVTDETLSALLKEIDTH